MVNVPDSSPMLPTEGIRRRNSPREPRMSMPSVEILRASSAPLQTRVTSCPAAASTAAVAPPMAPAPITTNLSVAAIPLPLPVRATVHAQPRLGQSPPKW